MIAETCMCGAAIQLAESAVNQPRACKACGGTLACISAEALTDGAGTGDFDARMIIRTGALANQQFLLGGVQEIDLSTAIAREFTCVLRRIDFGPSRWKIVNASGENLLRVGAQIVSERDLQNHDIVRIGQHEMVYVSTFQNSQPLEALPIDYAMPGAAQPVGRMLRKSDRRWVQGLRDGASLMLTMIAVNFFAKCVSGSTVLAILFGVLVAIVAFISTRLVSEPEPGNPDNADPFTLRAWLRRIASISLVTQIIAATVLALVSRFSGGDVMTVGVAIFAFLLHTLAQVVLLFLFLVYVRTLTFRIPDPGLATQMLVVMIGFPAAVMVAMLGTILGAASQNPIFIALGGLAGFVGILVFGIWYIVTLVQFRNALA